MLGRSSFQAKYINLSYRKRQNVIRIQVKKNNKISIKKVL